MKSWLKKGQLAEAGHKGRTLHAGYTMSEVLIVLAVTTVMFAAIAAIMQGRQATAEFNQAVRDYEAKLLNVMSDVRTGFYQSGFQCTAAGSAPPAVVAAPVDPASNSGCIFVGKVLQPSTTVPSSSIFTLVGRRTVGGPTTDEVETMDQAQPVVAHMTDETYIHTFQLQVRRIIRMGSGTTIHALGFVNKLSGGVSSGGAGAGGTNIIELYGLLNSSSLVSPDPVVDRPNFQPISQGAIICLMGQNGKRAHITVGAGASQTATFAVLDTRPTEAPCF